MAVLRHMGQTVHIAVADGGMADILAVEQDLAAVLFQQADDHADELALAVAFDTGYAEDLSLVDGERDLIQNILVRVALRLERYIFKRQDSIACMLGSLLQMEVDLTADHHFGKVLDAGGRNVAGADALAAAQDRAVVRNCLDLIELMGDKDDRLALALEVLHDDHQFVDLLRRQDSRRLVEDQDVVVLVEHLQDLYSLLHTHGDVRDSGIAVDIQAIALAQGKHLLARFLHLQDAVLCGLDAEDDVLEHGEVLHQHEVLMNHADTQRIGRARIFDLCLFAIHEDLALFRLIKAEQDAHQRRFTGAVLAQKGVYLAIADAQGDVVIRDDARKHLRDVQQLDRIVVHKMIPLVGKPGRETPQRSLPGPPYLIVVYSTT